MQFCPISAVTDLNRGKIDGMEVDIIFAHELVKVDILWVKPPLLPFCGIVGCDAGVTEGCIKLQKMMTKS